MESWTSHRVSVSALPKAHRSCSESSWFYSGKLYANSQSWIAILKTLHSTPHACCSNFVPVNIREVPRLNLGTLQIRTPSQQKKLDLGFWGFGFRLRGNRRDPLAGTPNPNALITLI